MRLLSHDVPRLDSKRAHCTVAYSTRSKYGPEFSPKNRKCFAQHRYNNQPLLSSYEKIVAFITNLAQKS
jgi:hypothetical protein